MYPAPVAALTPNTFAYETTPLVKPTGFREYDARWWFGFPGSEQAPEINLMGVTAIGLGFAAYLAELGVRREVVTGHDYRSYSSAIKAALIDGLLAGGLKVHDVGLAVTPMAYFAQADLDVPCVAMVTASHNENGWTGVKLGAYRPLTFGPTEMTRLKEIVLAGKFAATGGGAYHYRGDIAERYVADFTRNTKWQRRMKVVVACGNGTAGAFAPRVLEALGAEVVPLDTELDYRFPHYNPNPEDLHMLHAIADKVKASGADIGLGFDGDGDRCGVIDNRGEEIFADKVGVLLARELSTEHPGSKFVADVKSTALFKTDPVLIRNRAEVDYWKTGHSYIKQRVNEIGALAGFEKSGHYFFRPPIGRGYDDAIRSAIVILSMLDRHPGSSMADLVATLPKTWGSPTMAASCPDEEKYAVADKVRDRLQAMRQSGEKADGHVIADLITVNGVRAVMDDGTWGLVRASSNKPEMVVVIESPVSEARMREMFKFIDRVLRQNKNVGPYNQTI